MNIKLKIIIGTIIFSKITANCFISATNIINYCFAKINDNGTFGTY